MAEVQTTPEIEDTSIVVTKTVTTTEEGSTVTVVQEETTVTNGIHNGDADESTTTEVEVNDVAKVETAEAGQENGVEENGVSEEPEVTAEATDGNADETAEAVVEEPKEEVPPKVILHQFPPGKEIPSLSPFCLKVETFLRINSIPYENQYGYKMGKTGKLPWIEYNGERTPDSKFIIEYLREKFDANLDSELTVEQVSLGRAVTSMLEENTYWGLIYNRYVDQFNEYKKFMAQGAGIGFNVSQKMFQRKMRSNLDGHGLGRHTKDKVYKIAEDDINALSSFLGEKEFLLGDKITSYDCAVFGLCANILYSGMASPMKTYIEENATNVIDLCDKIKQAYWSDWMDMVEGEKEPVLRKGFSFRKKKTKVAKKETQADESEGGGEEAATDATPEEKPVNGDVATSPSLDEARTEEAPTEETPAEEATAEITTEESTASENKESSEPAPETTTEGSAETKPDEEA